MSEKTPRLPEKYLDVAKKIIKENPFKILKNLNLN